MRRFRIFLRCLAAATAALAAPAPFAAAQSAPIAIGLDADFSGHAAAGAVALRQGAEVAIEQINASGGVLGRPLRLVVSDHKANPRRGVLNFERLVKEEGVVALLAGVHSSVAIAQLEPAHQLRVPIISPWAAATPFIANGYDPNFAFRVSVRDEHAAGFLVGEAISRGYRRIGLLLENTHWGVSNEKGLRAAVDAVGIAEIVGVSWFAFGEENLSGAVQNVMDQAPDVIILVANPREGAAIVRELASPGRTNRMPVLSHWGVTAGDMLGYSNGLVATADFEVLQTFSFFTPYDPDIAAAFLKISCRLHAVCGPRDVISHTGMAHAYDSVHLIARAILAAGAADPIAIRAALENGTTYRGLVRFYSRSFHKGRHEALNRADFGLARYAFDGRLLPAFSERDR